MEWKEGNTKAQALDDILAWHPAHSDSHAPALARIERAPNVAWASMSRAGDTRTRTRGRDERAGRTCACACDAVRFYKPIIPFARPAGAAAARLSLPAAAVHPLALGTAALTRCDTYVNETSTSPPLSKNWIGPPATPCIHPKRAAAARGGNGAA